jgi:nucleotide-binding universal stress UspA family protein
VVYCLDLDLTAQLAMAGVVPMSVPQVTAAAIDEAESSMRRRLEDALSAMKSTGEAIVLRRPPAAGILEAAREWITSLIVVGTHGRSGLPRLALGSVAEAVIDRAECSVLVVPLEPRA